jgi:hypothetical protein
MSEVSYYPTIFSMIAVDREINELRNTLGVNEEIERVPPGDDILDGRLVGYRLVVPSKRG